MTIQLVLQAIECTASVVVALGVAGPYASKRIRKRIRASLRGIVDFDMSGLSTESIHDKAEALGYVYDPSTEQWYGPPVN